ncbi:hypothetical protein [Perigonia lusca single nucleopolyhedrovirus]|uniref:Ac53 n=1 Tax=Perigonia lusca single nucleopolyhedrovirus TaxID=1675865 RepID=A0A0M3WNM1_9ABAC|nr:hypothetical protein [Perigonia lusca single nucleopolyhedrovirus]AKN80637.1 hypothetical protein [Perigonia lusca single nucleopolyhedrovirus]
MLLTIDLLNKKEYLYRLFRKMWKEYTVECQICFDRIHDDGVVIVSEYGTLNLEKMFHISCWDRWYVSTSGGRRQRDPFNRPIKFKFNFPPKTFEECSFMLDQIKGFIGDESVDKNFSLEYQRAQEESVVDIEIDLNNLLKF